MSRGVRLLRRIERERWTCWEGTQEQLIGAGLLTEELLAKQLEPIGRGRPRPNFTLPNGREASLTRLSTRRFLLYEHLTDAECEQRAREQLKLATLRRYASVEVTHKALARELEAAGYGVLRVFNFVGDRPYGFDAETLETVKRAIGLLQLALANGDLRLSIDTKSDAQLQQFLGAVQSGHDDGVS